MYLKLIQYSNFIIKPFNRKFSLQAGLRNYRATHAITFSFKIPGPSIQLNFTVHI